MNLTPEEKARGKENFHAVIGSDLTRREFLGRGLAAGVVSGAGLGGFYYGYTKITDPVRVAVIGTGDEGNVLIGAHTPDYVDIIAICDIRPYNIHRAFHGDQSSPNAAAVRAGLLKKRGWKTEDEAKKHVKIYEDYKEVLKNKDVEAVIIALPLHLHDVVAIDAMKAGKHVLTEKLMAHSVHQCKDMSRVAAQQKLHLATGHQRHYSILYDNAVDTLKRGLLGDVHHIRAQWHRGNLPGKDSWQQPLPADMEKSLAKLLNDIKDPKNKRKVADLEKRKALLEQQVKDAGVAADKYGYQSYSLPGGYAVSPLEELIRWRLFQRTGGGLMAELGSHQLDASGIFCSAQRGKDQGKALPLSVTALGVRSLFDADREVHDHVHCLYEYPAPDYNAKDEKLREKKITVAYSSINGNGFGGYGEVVMATKGTLILENEQEVMLYKDASTSTSVSVVKKDGGPTLDTTASGGAGAAVAKAALDSGPVSRGYTEEIEHFAWCIRNFDLENNRPKCHPAVAMADAIIALTTNIAMKENKRIEFKPEWFDINSDETPEGVKPSVKA